MRLVVFLRSLTVACVSQAKIQTLRQTLVCDAREGDKLFEHCHLNPKKYARFSLELDLRLVKIFYLLYSY